MLLRILVAWIVVGHCAPPDILARNRGAMNVAAYAEDSTIYAPRRRVPVAANHRNLRFGKYYKGQKIFEVDGDEDWPISIDGDYIEEEEEEDVEEDSKIPYKPLFKPPKPQKQKPTALKPNENGVMIEKVERFLEYLIQTAVTIINTKLTMTRDVLEKLMCRKKKRSKTW